LGKKVKATLSIDEEILEAAKKTVPNLSKLFEDLLKEILDMQSIEQVELIARLKDKEEIVTKEKIEIVALRHQIENAENIVTAEEIEAKEKDRIWRKCLVEQRDYGNISNSIFKNALQLLGKDEETFNKMVDDVLFDYSNGNIEDVNQLLSWDYVKNHYPLKEVEITDEQWNEIIEKEKERKKLKETEKQSKRSLLNQRR